MSHELPRMCKKQILLLQVLLLLVLYEYYTWHSFSTLIILIQQQYIPGIEAVLYNNAELFSASNAREGCAFRITSRMWYTNRTQPLFFVSLRQAFFWTEETEKIPAEQAVLLA